MSGASFTAGAPRAVVDRQPIEAQRRREIRGVERGPDAGVIDRELLHVRAGLSEEGRERGAPGAVCEPGV